MRRGVKKGLVITGIVFGVIVCFVLAVGITSRVGNEANMKYAAELEKVVVDDPLPAPFIDEETGYYTFTADRDFKVLQLTDVHIGGGAFSLRKDMMAMNAVYDLVSYTKPDLIIVTGDMAYPVPFSSGSFNNLAPTKIFVEMMESIGIYWAVVFGNHDSEVYSYYTREEISDYYSSDDLEYCLYQAGPDDVDGYGNYFINIENSDGIITQSLALFDSHSYARGFYQDYDNIHANQVVWYEEEIKRMDEINRLNGATELFKSLAFFHIPLVEQKDAYFEWLDNGSSDTENVKYVYGNAGEGGKVVCSGIGEDDLFETMVRVGSTQGVFVGHDHYNNFSLWYNGGSGDYYIKLTYGMSIDYLAYFGIAKETAQRGGTVIEISPDGSFDCYGLRMIDKKEIRKIGDF